MNEPTPTPRFTVLYRWRVHAGAEAAFVDAWRRVTEGLRLRHGSFGSRLHRGADGLWYAYAQWSSAEARAAAFAEPPADPAARDRMRAAIAESLPEIVLKIEADLLTGSASA